MEEAGSDQVGAEGLIAGGLARLIDRMMPAGKAVVGQARGRIGVPIGLRERELESGVGRERVAEAGVEFLGVKFGVDVEGFTRLVADPETRGEFSVGRERAAQVELRKSFGPAPDPGVEGDLRFRQRRLVDVVEGAARFPDAEEISRRALQDLHPVDGDVGRDERIEKEAVGIDANRRRAANVGPVLGLRDEVLDRIDAGVEAQALGFVESGEVPEQVGRKYTEAEGKILRIDCHLERAVGVGDVVTGVRRRFDLEGRECDCSVLRFCRNLGRWGRLSYYGRDPGETEG